MVRNTKRKLLLKNATLISLLFLIFVGTFSLYVYKNGKSPHSLNKAGDLNETSHNCRFWGMLTPGSFDDSSAMSHLKSLQQLAPSNPNGWGFGFYTKTLKGGHIPVDYRGMWRADQDYLFDSCARMMLDNVSISAIAHIRNASSGYVNIPDPHPFYTKSVHRGFSMFFAHNGTLDKVTLISMLGLYTNANHYSYSGNGTNDPNLDSDLYRLFLMKWIDEHPFSGITACLNEALDTLTTQMGYNLSYNFVISSTCDTLWALCYNNTLSYRCQSQPQGYVWEVASQPLGSSDWTRATNHYLYVFSANQATPDSIQIKNEAYGLPENPDKIAPLSFGFQNPVNGNTLNVRIVANDKRLVSLQLFGLNGRFLSKMSDIIVQKGENQLVYEIGFLRPGVYFMKIESGKYSQTKKMIVVE